MATARLNFPMDQDPTLPGHPDPYPLFRELRETEPVHFNPYMKGWVITRYADAVAYLRDQRFSRIAYLNQMREQFGDDTPIIKFQSRELAFMDPPEHNWLKNVVGKAFSPQVIAQSRANIEAAVERMLALVADRGAMDIIADLAYPLPADVIASMLGVPDDDWRTLRAWVDGIVASRGIVRTPEMMAEGDRSARAFHDYLAKLVAERRAKPQNDLMSGLVAADERARKLDDDEIVTMIETLFAAGHATTRNLIATGILTLLRDPHEMRRLRENPALIESAVEEMLRYDPPTQAPSPQVALEDVEIGGKNFRRGDTATVLFGATNRDPARFGEPDKFDIARKDNEHLAFSHGTHYCLGASLARLEAQVAIASLLKRFPKMSLATDALDWRKMGRFRGLTALPVEFR
jgi:cytochrome P450